MELEELKQKQSDTPKKKKKKNCHGRRNKLLINDYKIVKYASSSGDVVSIWACGDDAKEFIPSREPPLSSAEVIPTV